MFRWNHFRAFVTDKLPDSQVNRGFIMQSFMIGLGGSIASALPWILKNIFHHENTASKGSIPENVKLSFYIGAFFFLSLFYTLYLQQRNIRLLMLLIKIKIKESNKGFGGGLLRRYSVHWRICQRE